MEPASDIDPRLLKRFALFRGPGPDPDGQLTEDETKVLDALSRHREGYVLDCAVKVVVSTSTTLLVIPGRDGVLIAQRGPAARRYAASGAATETVLRGKPVGSYGALLFGLSPDGVKEQVVELADGSTESAPVTRNVFAVIDQTRTPPN
jgi:hypothetical protein